MRLENAHLLSKTRDYGRGLAIDGMQLQRFTVHVNNNAGTLRHAFSGSSVLSAPAPWCNRIIGVNQDLSYSNTPTVGSGTAFVNGAGFAAGASTTDRFVFNTEDQAMPRLEAVGGLIDLVAVELYSGNNVRPRIAPHFTSRDVVGNVIRRLELEMTDDMTGAAWNFNTTTLPSGTSLIFSLLVALR